MFFPSRAGFFKSSVVNIPFVCDLDEDDRTGEEGRGGGSGLWNGSQNGKIEDGRYILYLNQGTR